MSYENVGRLVDKWLNDDKFRQQLRKDAEGTLRQCKVTLSKEEVAMLKSVDWNLSDEELSKRITKIPL